MVFAIPLAPSRLPGSHGRDGLPDPSLVQRSTFLGYTVFMSDRVQIKESGPLLAVLVERFPEWRRITLKNRLKAGLIEVNGQATTRHDHALVPGDLIEIWAKGTERSRRGRGQLVMLHTDEHLIAIHKPRGLLSVSTEREKQRTALAMVRDGLGRRARLWPINRLDRETSGVLLFARSREVREEVQSAWSEATKTYLAIVEGHPEPPEGSLNSPCGRIKH